MELNSWPKRGGRAARGLWLVLALVISGVGIAIRISAASPQTGTQADWAQDQTPQTDLAAKSTASTQDPDAVSLPAGTVISVRLADTVDSNKNHIGDQFSGTIDPSVLVGDHVVIPRGTEAHVRLVDNKKGGRIHGHAEVKLELTSLVINGTRIDVESDTYRQKQGLIGAKVKGEGKASANATAAEAGDVASGTPNPLDAGGPIVAAFRAADVKKPAGTKIDFVLTEPFTFEKATLRNDER